MYKTVYVAIVQEADFETTEKMLGVFWTQAKAEYAIMEYLKKAGLKFDSYQQYKDTKFTEDDFYYWTWIRKYEVE